MICCYAKMCASECLELLVAYTAQQIRSFYDASMKLLRAYGIRSTPMGDGRVTLDFDVTTFENSKTKKEGVSCIYAGYDGLASIIAHIGFEGYILREDKPHSQKGIQGQLEHVLQRALRLVTNRLLVSMDYGNDSVENMQVMFSLIAMGQEIDFIIKRNLCKEIRKDVV